jgi:hypothetical protein
MNNFFIGIPGYSYYNLQPDLTAAQSVFPPFMTILVSLMPVYPKMMSPAGLEIPALGMSFSFPAVDYITYNEEIIQS